MCFPASCPRLGLCQACFYRLHCLQRPVEMPDFKECASHWQSAVFCDPLVRLVKAVGTGESAGPLQMDNLSSVIRPVLHNLIEHCANVKLSPHMEEAVLPVLTVLKGLFARVCHSRPA